MAYLYYLSLILCEHRQDDISIVFIVKWTLMVYKIDMTITEDWELYEERERERERERLVSNNIYIRACSMQVWRM